MDTSTSSEQRQRRRDSRKGDIINVDKRNKEVNFKCFMTDDFQYRLFDPLGRGWRWNASTDRCEGSEILK